MLSRPARGRTRPCQPGHVAKAQGREALMACPKPHILNLISPVVLTNLHCSNQGLYVTCTCIWCDDSDLISGMLFSPLGFELGLLQFARTRIVLFFAHHAHVQVLANSTPLSDASGSLVFRPSVHCSLCLLAELTMFGTLRLPDWPDEIDCWLFLLLEALFALNSTDLDKRYNMASSAAQSST